MNETVILVNVCELKMVPCGLWNRARPLCRCRAVPCNCHSCKYFETFVLQYSVLQSSLACYTLASFTHQFKILDNSNEYCLMWKYNGNFPCLLTAEFSNPCLYLAGVLLVLLLACALPSLPGVAQRGLGTMRWPLLPQPLSVSALQSSLNGRCHLIHWGQLGQQLTAASADRPGSNGQSVLALTQAGVLGRGCLQPRGKHQGGAASRANLLVSLQTSFCSPQL